MRCAFEGIARSVECPEANCSHLSSVRTFNASPSHLSSKVLVPAPKYATPSISAVWQTRQFTVHRSGWGGARLGPMPYAGTDLFSGHSTRPTLSRMIVFTSPATACVNRFHSNTDCGIHADVPYVSVTKLKSCAARSGTGG